MKVHPKQYLIIGHLILGLCLLGCAIIIPHYFFSLNQGGVSNYGTDQRTRGLFVVGFGIAAISTAIAGYYIGGRSRAARSFRIALYGIGLLYLLVMVTTFSYKISPAYGRLHEWAAIGLFAGMLACVVWLSRQARQDTKIRLAASLFFAGFLLAILAVFGVLHLLFTAQIVCGISFAYILTRSAERFN